MKTLYESILSVDDLSQDIDIAAEQTFLESHGISSFKLNGECAICDVVSREVWGLDEVVKRFGCKQFVFKHSISLSGYEFRNLNGISIKCDDQIKISGSFGSSLDSIKLINNFLEGSSVVFSEFDVVELNNCIIDGRVYFTYVNKVKTVKCSIEDQLYLLLSLRNGGARESKRINKYLKICYPDHIAHRVFEPGASNRMPTYIDVDILKLLGMKFKKQPNLIHVQFYGGDFGFIFSYRDWMLPHSRLYEPIETKDGWLLPSSEFITAP